MDVLSALSREPLDDTSNVPLYRQLKHRILQIIATGALHESDPLPTEQKLCRALGLSRATVRRCFKDLVDEGYVTRRAGRGTFVAPSSTASGLDTAYEQVRTSVSIELSGAEAGNRLLRIREIPADDAVAQRLDLDPKAPVWEVNRLRLSNGKPILHEVAYVSLKLVPDLGRRDFERSLYEYIAESSGTFAARTDETIEAVALDAREARLLGADKGAPALRIIATSFDAAGTPFETSVGIALAGHLRVLARYGIEGQHVRKAFR